MVKIVIADDHIVLRQGLRGLLGKVSDWEVVGEACDGFEVLPLVEEHQPDIVILDLSMPNLGGVETIARLKKLKNCPKILVLSAREDECSVNQAIRAGAKGYLPKTSDSDELTFALNSLLKGQSYISPSVCEGVLQRGDGEDGTSAESPLAVLTSREREVMKLLCEGQPNREVAKLLHISPRTIDSHRANILRKLGATSNAELVQLGVRFGLVD